MREVFPNHWVHQNYKTIIQDTTKKRKCLAQDCDKIFSYKTSHNHLKAHWVHEHDEFVTRKFTIHPFHDDKWINSLVKLIIKEKLEYSLVESEYFREFAKEMNPLKRIISRHQLSELIINKAEEFQKTITNHLSKSLSISLTADIWTARKGTRGFGAITAHYIDDSMNLRSLVLEFKHLTFPHDTQTLKKFLFDVIVTFDLTEKVVAITTDNASVNTAAIEQLDQELNLSDNHGLNSLHVRCMAHVINLAVNMALKKLKDTINPAKHIVATITSSTKRKERFALIQKQITDEQSLVMGTVSTAKPLNLIEDVETRWNSTFLLIRRFLKLRSTITRAIRDMEELKGYDAMIDWSTLETLEQFLEPFFDLTEKLSGASYSTISIINTCIPTLLNHVELYAEDIDVGDAAEAFKEKMLEYERFLCHDIAIIASVLDPRTKMSFLPHEKHAETEKKLLVLVERNKQDDLSPSIDQSQCGMATRRSIFEESYVQEEVNEVTHYLNSLREPYKTDPLKYWLAQREKYPHLYILARKVLNVQATSVESERVFSTAGLIDTARRNKLSDDSMRSNLLLDSWINLLSNLD